MPSPGPVAALRVYEPLAAFPDADRTRWARLVASGSGLDRAAAATLERDAALRAAVGGGLPDDGGGALVADLDGVALVCPLALPARAAGAWAEFSSDLADVVASAFLPRPLEEPEPDEGPGPWVLDSPWHVPLRWFVLVDPEERVVALGEGSLRTGRGLVYRTAMSRARRRAARALAVLRRTTSDSDVVEAVEDLGRWLEGFHPRSLVELDYGGLVHLLDDAALLQDESAKDVAEALAALGEGRVEDAGAAYARVAERMKALQAVESRS